MDYKEYCIKKYNEIYTNFFKSCTQANVEERERFAQKKAIKDTTILAMLKYSNIEPADIWKSIYASHVNRKSGIKEREIIEAVISADNSWAKASGHAFEEIVKQLGNEAFAQHDKRIKIYLQKDLKHAIDNNEICNESQDIAWLKEKCKTSDFDLYITIEKDNNTHVYGCIQAKSSIRDRVTRDREPSIHAMDAFFWSIAIVLDGDFLRLPKFKSMVNGGGSGFDKNGWHSMYVFSDKYSNGRIVSIGIQLENFVKDAIIAGNYWLNQRQWMNQNWKPPKS